jgi:FHA domain
VPDTPQTWPGRKPRPEAKRYRFALLYGEREIPLPPGAHTLGRSPSCRIVMDDMLASRKHARLLVSDVSLTIEDLGSSNGVYVNDRLIEAPAALENGDCVLIGTQQLCVFARAATAPVPAPAKVETGAPPSSDPTGRRMATTAKRDVFEGLGRVADRMLTFGRAEVAVQLLGGHLRALLKAARDGRLPSQEVRESATHYALKLAVAASDPAWVDLAVELNMAAKRPMTEESIAKLGELVYSLRGIDGELFLFYQELLRANVADMSPAERELSKALFRIRLAR